MNYIKITPLIRATNEILMFPYGAHPPNKCHLKIITIYVEMINEIFICH